MLTPFYSGPIQMYDLVNAFFAYSFLGWCMECVVVRREKGAWENRGFARSPFCVIYGFGAILGYALLRPFSIHPFALYMAGAAMATLFEYLTAKLMLRMFGNLWWDYSNKKFNYKGILCLESSIGWGLIAWLLFACLHRWVFGVVQSLPPRIGVFLAVVLVTGYAVDFCVSVRTARKNAETGDDAEGLCAQQTAE